MTASALDNLNCLQNSCFQYFVNPAGLRLHEMQIPDFSRLMGANVIKADRARLTCG